MSMLRSIRVALSQDEDITLQAELLAEEHYTVGNAEKESLKLFKTQAGTLVLVKALEGKTTFCLFCARPTNQLFDCAAKSRIVREELHRLFPRKTGN